MTFPRPRGYRLFNANEAVDKDSLVRVGTAALAAAWDLIAARMNQARGYAGVPALTNSPPSGFRGSDCLVYKTGAGSIGWLEGVAYRFVDGTGNANEYATPDYRLHVVEDGTLTVAANASGSTRYDVVYVACTIDDGESASRRVRPSGPGSQVVQTLYTSKTYVGTVAIYAGTPGGGVPSPPFGGIAIAEIEVPTGTPGSASIVVRDVRNRIRNGTGFESIPDPGAGTADAHRTPYAAPRVVTGMTTSFGSSGMTVDVDYGVIDVGGVRTVFAGQDAVGVMAAHSTLNRIDLVYHDRDTNIIGVFSGTAATDPIKPSIPTGYVDQFTPLCWIYVPAAAPDITACFLHDCRRTSGVADIVHQRPTFSASLLEGASSAGYEKIKVQAVDRDGFPVADTVAFTVELVEYGAGATGQSFAVQDTSLDIGTVSIGTTIGGGGAFLFVRTNSSGVFEFRVNNPDSVSHSCALRITPVSEGWGFAGPSGPIPGYVTVYDLTVAPP